MQEKLLDPRETKELFLIRRIKHRIK